MVRQVLRRNDLQQAHRAPGPHGDADLYARMSHSGSSAGPQSRGRQPGRAVIISSRDSRKGEWG